MKINNIEQVTNYTIENDLRELIKAGNFKDCQFTVDVYLYDTAFVMNSYVIEYVKIRELIHDYFNSYDTSRIPFDEYELFISIDTPNNEFIVEILN